MKNRQPTVLVVPYLVKMVLSRVAVCCFLKCLPGLPKMGNKLYEPTIINQPQNVDYSEYGWFQHMEAKKIFIWGYDIMG